MPFTADYFDPDLPDPDADDNDLCERCSSDGLPHEVDQTNCWNCGIRINPIRRF